MQLVQVQNELPTVLMTYLYKSAPVTDPFILNNAACSPPLMKIASTLVITMSILSSMATEEDFCIGLYVVRNIGKMLTILCVTLICDRLITKTELSFLGN